MHRYEGDWNEYMRTKMNELIDEINEIKKLQASCERDKEAALGMQLTEKMMSHSTNYTNLILVAGYAGLFSFWSTLVDRLPQWVYAVSGLLALTSLILFVAWEITKMVWTYKSVTGNNQLLKELQRTQRFGPMLEAAMYRQNIKMHKTWKWFFICTVVPGVASALLLLGTFIYQASEALWRAIC